MAKEKEPYQPPGQRNVISIGTDKAELVQYLEELTEQARKGEVIGLVGVIQYSDWCLSRVFVGSWSNDLFVTIL